MLTSYSPISLGQYVKSIGTEKFVLTETIHPAYRRLPSHSHERANLAFVLNGSFTETVNNRPFDCRPHSLVLKPAGEAHSNRYGPTGVRCLIIELLPSLVELLGPSNEILDDVSHTRGGTLAGLAARIYQEFRIADTASTLAIEGLLLEMLAYMSRQSASPSRKPARWLEEAKELLHAQFRESISLGIVARSVGVHPVHLSRQFRKVFGCTVGEYIRRLRIEFACHELSASDLPLFQIAAAAGFSDHSHFTRTFKRFKGTTPADYRIAFRRAN